MTLPDLAALVREAPVEELPALLGRLAEAQAVALARLTTPASGTNGHECQEAGMLDCLDFPDVAKHLRIPEDRARDLGRRGELPVVEIGKYKRVRISALLAYIQAHEKKGLDGRLSGVLRSHRDQGRGKAAASETRAHASGLRRVGRHASRHGLEVGDGRVGGRPAVVEAHGAAVQDAAAEAKG